VSQLASEAAESKTFRLSRRLTVEITVGLGGLVCEWTPTVPSKLTDKELKRYPRGRDELLARLAHRLGSSVAVVEV